MQRQYARQSLFICRCTRIFKNFAHDPYAWCRFKSTNRYGGTALIPASERGYVETARTLIAAGVNVNHVNNLGWTALLEAIMLGNGTSNYQHIVALLLKAGANPNLADRDGVSPLQHARTRGYREIEKLLLSAGAK